MRPTITAFAKSPDRGRGLARDTRVRWALEEVSQPYDVRLLSFAEMKEPEHLTLNPFGQIPTQEDGEVALFESGAIILRIAETHDGLLPLDTAARSRAIMWMFAAVNTVEPPIVDRTMVFLLERDEPWFEARLKSVEAQCRRRLEQLSAWLGEKDWLEYEFSVGDLMMIPCCRGWARRGWWTRFRTWPPMSRAVRRGRRISGRSRPSWRCSRRRRPEASRPFCAGL